MDNPLSKGTLEGRKLRAVVTLVGTHYKYQVRRWTYSIEWIVHSVAYKYHPLPVNKRKI